MAAATQGQALAALLFLYRQAIGRPLRLEGCLPRARTPTRLPVVLTRSEVAAVLGQLEGGYRLVGTLLYGSGMRLLECLTLRIKDVDLERGEIRIRRGNGGVDRVTVLPEAVRSSLAAHLGRVRALHGEDLAAGGGMVALPGALDRKRPHAWPWLWIFPAGHLSGRGTGGAAAASPTSLGDAASDGGGGAPVGGGKAGQLSHPAA